MSKPTATSTEVFTESDITDRVTVRHFNNFGEVFAVFVGSVDTEWREHHFAALSRVETAALRDALTEALGA